ncbi:MAG: hypothetical protein C4B58_03580 [Deltaproteobacteria bacterium]|nr:MAG: hypothetical protein C4B58_03580 [Deltaproteobacteria bacterium]
MPVSKITIAPYLQKWDNDTRKLSIRMLVAPTGNPLEPILNSPVDVPAFADCSLAFRVSISDTVGALPQRTLVDQTIDTPRAGAPDARTIFIAIKSALEIPDGPAGDTFSEQKPDMVKQLHKYLPRSYRQSFDFVQPRTSLAVTDDSYRCLVSCPPDALPPLPDTVIGWGEAIAFSLRRPRLAEALGLIVPLELTLDAAPRLENGGWLWAELAPESDYFGQAGLPDFLRVFATRVPELPAAGTRPIFTPVVFPVSDNAADAATLGQVDKVFAEAVRFDDGFSKIVHARQPLSVDLLDEDGTKGSAPRDEGVQLAWDDEDILEGQNRALGAAPDGENNVVAPRGVFGYRVDVRKQDTSNPQSWIPLSKVRSPLDLGVDLGTAIEERWTEVHPTELSNQLWLSPWYVSWRGGSLVMSTNDDQRLMNVPPTDAEPDQPVEVDKIDLCYGERYEFRVRLADSTGGGPDVTQAAVRSGEVPITMLHMKRHLPPRRPPTATPTLATDGSTSTIRLWRPPLGYPEAVFAAGASARTSLLQQITANDADVSNATPPFIRDPDTPYLRVRVHLRAPTFDPDAAEGGWVLWYETSRPYPTDTTQPLDLNLDWREAADYHDIDISGQLGADGTIIGPLTVIKSRDVRLEIFAVGSNDLSYFANQKARIGESDKIDLHVVAASESDVLATLPPSDMLRSVLFRADPIGSRSKTRGVVAQNDPTTSLVDRLAVAANLASDGAMFLGRPGERVAFGCAGLTYYAAPDASSLEFAEPDELTGQWINVAQAVFDRDWTWRGAGSPTVRVTRRLSLPDAPGNIPERVDLGEIELMHTINVQARQDPERDHIRLIFVDAFPPPLGSDSRPYEVEVTYVMTVSLEGGTSVTQTIDSRLPVATPPTQVPKVKAAGIALTPYKADKLYATTAPRTKRLWLEFEEPLQDPRDRYFVRALHRTPDPMLLPGHEPVADPAVLESIPLNPEWVRVITPGQVQDLSGLSAMQRLEPADNSNRQFLVPLPHNTDPASPELFSFYTYEIRVGHGAGAPEDPFWSTAQGRFGEPLVLEGMQHPPPELACSVFYGPGGDVTARAPFAAPYLGQKRVAPPQVNTQIWFVLYARIMQADGQSWHNVQIDLKPAIQAKQVGSVTIAPQAEATWTGGNVKDALELAGLHHDTPLTVLAVELLPEPNSSFADPLGGDLGQVRVLRTSPLASVERDCCA